MGTPVTKGSTDVSVYIRIVDSTTGLPEEAVEHNTAGIALWYRRDGAARTTITPAALASLTTAHTDGGIEHVDDGYYRLDVADAAFATGVDKVLIGGTVTGMLVYGTEIALVDSIQDVNVTQIAGGAVPTPAITGVPDVNATHWRDEAIPATTNTGQPLVDLSDDALDDISGLGAADEGTAQAGGSTTITLRSGASATDDIYNDAIVEVTSGTGAGQAQRITDYDGGTKVATVEETWIVTPDATSVYKVYPAAAPASGGGGSSDWSTTEKNQIRHRLGVDGTTATPSTNDPNLGTVDSNVVSVSGDTTAADNLEADYDGTGYNKSNSTIGTTTTNTDMRGTDGANTTTPLTALQVNAEVDTALSDIHLDHLLAADYDPASKPGTATALLNELVESDGGVSRFTSNALENAPSGGGGGSSDWTTGEREQIRYRLQVDGTQTAPATDAATQLPVDMQALDGGAQSAADLKDFADAGYDPATNKVEGVKLVDTTTANTDMRGTDSANTTTPPTVAAIRAEIDSNSTQLAAIVADTNELQGDWEDGGRLDLLIDAILTDTGTTLAGKIDTIDGIVDSILADTGTDGVVLSTAMLNKIADHVLRRSWESAADSSDGDTKALRSLLGAVAKLVNRVAVSGSTLTVYEEDDSTSLGTQTVTTNASADPITEVNTN